MIPVPRGNIVASVPRGTGIMVMANQFVRVVDNLLDGNQTAQIMVLAYPNAFEDTRYNPLPRDVAIMDNTFIIGGEAPDVSNGAALVAAFGGRLPPIMWDGLGDAPVGAGNANTLAWTMNLPNQGAAFDKARPEPLRLTEDRRDLFAGPLGASEGVEARLTQ
jgi:hypothetical protein